MRPHALKATDLDVQQVARESDGPDLLTQVQVCARLGISDETWRTWRKAGHTPQEVVLPSGRLKWRRADIDRLAGQAPEQVTRRRFFGSARHVAKVARISAVHQTNNVAPKAGVR